jgi:hypothetical protein
VAKIYRCTFKCSYSDGTLVQPSIHVLTDVPTAGSEPNPSDISDGVWGNLEFYFKPCCPTTVTIHELVATECVIPPAIADEGHTVIETAGTGSVGDGDLPRELVALLNIHTNTASRSARGWMFLPSPGDAGALVDGGWHTDYQTKYGDLAGQLDLSFTLGSLFPSTVNTVVYSRQRHLRGLEPHAFRVTSATLNPRPKWLRSRGSTP